MERRIYFVLGDCLANSTVGALCALAAVAIVGPSWNMVVAMGVGMIAGMALAIPASLLFMPFFGAMEVMVPVMLTGMLSGMGVAMAAAMRELSLEGAAVAGASTGLGVLAVVTLVNIQLHGRVDEWTS